MGIRIDALDPTVLPSREHVIPAMKDGITVRLTVGQIIDLLIGAAPGTLDTLEELAAALGDDENFAATVMNALAARLEKTQNLADLANVETARENLGATEIGDALFTAEDAKTVRSNIGAIGNLHKITYITSSGTHTYDSQSKYAEIEVVGGGGGGGGGNAGASAAAAGTGGGAGGYVSKFISLTGIATATVTIGAGGGVSSITGLDGGDSTYYDGINLLTAGGGKGGPGGSSTAPWRATTGGVGGTASGGDINVTGQTGGLGWGGASTTHYILCLGHGGHSRYGAGGRDNAAYNNGGSSGTPGTAATGYGSGGSAGGSYNSGGSYSGGNGAPGIVVIREYK